MAEDDGGYRDEHNMGLRPIPDPTVLTTAQLDRGLRALREVLETRMDGMDREREMLRNIIKGFPEVLDGQFRAISTLNDEKFRSIEKQFVERDTRHAQQFLDNKVALDAALQATKEANMIQSASSTQAWAKAEGVTQRQIDQIETLLQTSVSAIHDKIEDIKSRLTLIEGRTAGMRSAESSIRGDMVNVIGIIGMVVGAVMGIGGILVALYVGKG